MSEKAAKTNIVIPAQAGIHNASAMETVLWVPACAGTTV